MAFITTKATSSTSLLCKRFQFNLLQTFKFSTNTPTTTTTTTTTTSDASKTTKPKKKKKNLFEVAQFLPNWGLGYHLAKSHWSNVSYEITKINLYKDGRHGKAWGLAYKDGLPAPAPKKISGVHKRCWKYIANPIKLEVSKTEEAQEA
ncbi:hypothetical protein vseg_004243 [Gypsophila vaccaria]